LGIPADQVEVPQGLAARMCWEEFVAEVARVYETLPEGDRKESVILTGDYNGAGAIDLLGKEYGLPPAISAYNNYYLWGPGDTSWNVVIALLHYDPKDLSVASGATGTRLEDMFGEVVEAGRTSCEYTNAHSVHGSTIYVCREPKRPIAEVWAEWKLFL